MELIHVDRQSGAVGQLVQPQGQMTMFCIIAAQDPLRQTALPLDVEQEQLMEMLAMTQEALEAQNLVMYYQPVVTELCSKVVYGRVTTGLNEVAYCCYKGFPTQRAT